MDTNKPRNLSIRLQGPRRARVENYENLTGSGFTSIMEPLVDAALDCFDRYGGFTLPCVVIPRNEFNRLMMAESSGQLQSEPSDVARRPFKLTTVHGDPSYKAQSSKAPIAAESSSTTAETSESDSSKRARNLDTGAEHLRALVSARKKKK